MKHWKETTLGEVAEDIAYGYTESASIEAVGPKFLRITDIQDDFINWDSVPYCPISEKDHKKYKLEIGDVVIARTGNSTGATATIKKEVDAVFASYLIRFKIDAKKADYLFIDFLLRSEYWKAFVKSVKGGSAQGGANAKNFAEFPILLPPLPEQKAIAGILSSFDDKIELLRRQNKTLEQIAQTIFKQSFVKDESWDGNLSEYLKVQGGYAFKGDDFKETGFAGIIKITNITMSVVDIHNSQFVGEDIVRDIDEDKFRIKDGDFLIAMTGAEIGKIGIVEKTKKQIWLNQRVGKLVAKVPYGDIAGFLALRSREGQEHIIDAASGSAQANISSTGIEEMAFATYSEKVTNSFGEKVKPLFEKITFNLSQIQTLSKLRDALLPKLMRGEIRVKNGRGT